MYKNKEVLPLKDLNDLNVGEVAKIIEEYQRRL